MQWPDKRFEAFYIAHVRRKAVDEITLRKNMQISALFANSNFDTSEAQELRNQIIQKIEDSYVDMVNSIYGVSSETEIDENDPFMGPSKRAMEKLKEIPEMQEEGNFLERFMPVETTNG